MIGRTISHYRIIEKLGEGGMGVVYKAEDTQLRRTVALKFLAQQGLNDPETKTRLIREAQAAASLDHPHICSVYGIHEEDGQTFIAMAYIDGGSLADKIKQRPLAFEEALNIAIQMGEGLQEAHEQGVVHRDIKPANIMLTRKDRVKVMDFGLAYLAGRSKLTKSGTAMGTAVYMSPEQALGQPVDRRCDIWSLGVVLYEMLAGKPPFDDKHEQAIVYSIVNEEPESLTARRTGLPIDIDRIIAKALAKNPAERYQHVEDMLVDLRALRTRVEGKTPKPLATPSATVGSRRWWAWGLVGAALVAVVALGAWNWTREGQQSGFLADPVPLSSLGGQEQYPTFSPDGTRVAFSWSGETGENADIYIQVVGSSNFLQLTSDPATDLTPAWSPDGRQIAFVRTSSTEQAIYLTSPVGGAERKVTEFSHPYSPQRASTAGLAWTLAWTPDGKSILFCEPESPGAVPAIYRFFLETGEKQRLTSPPSEMYLGDAFPAVSPDGRTLAFARGTSAKREIYLVPLEGGDPRELTSQGQLAWGLAWTADGREIVYAQAPAIGSAARLWRISVSGGAPRPVPEAGQDVQFPAISPSGKRLVYERINSDANVWLYALPEENTQPPRKIIASTQTDTGPQISPDGNRIVFASNRTGGREIWVCNRDGSNLVQLTSFGAAGAGSPRWSPDGRHIVFDAALRGDWDIFVVDAQGGTARLLTTSYEGEDVRPSWSHDGRWIYFASNRSGTHQVWKLSPEGGQPVQVTHGGGFRPFESPDGHFLYFARALGDPGVWSVPVEGGREVVVQGAAKVWEQGWKVAANGIYFLEYRPTSAFISKWFLRLLRSGTAEAVDIMELPPPHQANSLDIAPDGTWFVYAQSEQVGSDLMLLENFE